MPSPAYELAHCIVCGHADATVLAEAEDVRAEVESLWAYHQRRLRPDTPSDRLMDRVAFSERPPFRLVQCNDCGLVYRNPVERERELHDMYARQSPTPEVMRTLHETQLPAVRAQARELRRVLGRGGAGLEVGSYVGAFLAAARERGLQMEGLDINADVNAFARSLGFVVHDGELATFAPSRTYDAIAVWNTFDQLPDPRAAAVAAHKLLAPGGVLAIRVPNGGFYAEQRRRLTAGNTPRRRAARALLAQNNLLTFPYRWGFTPRALARLLAQAGFAVERLRGDVLVPVADEWTRRWARLEETVIKRVLVFAARQRPWAAPWFEVYAKRST